MFSLEVASTRMPWDFNDKLSVVIRDTEVSVLPAQLFSPVEEAVGNKYREKLPKIGLCGYKKFNLRPPSAVHTLPAKMHTADEILTQLEILGKG